MQVTLCVDALEPQLGGIGRYTWELCKGLPGRTGIDSVRYYGRSRLLSDPAALLRGEKPRPRLPVLARFQRWHEYRKLRAGLIHGPNYFLPRFAETGIVTVHDLSVFRYPETHPAERVKAFEREFSSSLERAAHIITDTETVRNELMEAFSLRPEQVTAVWLGVDPAYAPLAEDDLRPRLAALGLEAGHYGLCVSTLEPRKKIAQLLAAWRLLPPSVRDRTPLVLAGGKGWLNEQLHEQIAAAQAEGWLRQLGFVEEGLLPSLYAGASLFVYPSTYEGFGLPPLEAMASGVPVLVSDRSCLPEVCGDAAEYMDPDDVTGFASILERLLTDETLRHSLIRNGLTRARLFSWERCMEGTVLAYKSASRRL